MVLIASEKTWTIGLCSIYVLHNTILARTWKNDKNKGPPFLNSGVFQKNYQFEDFFWTGSGDGPITENFFINNTEDDTRIIHGSPFDTWKTTTVFHTTTILFATVYPNDFGCSKLDCLPEISPVTTGSIDFSLPASPTFLLPEIEPTPTVKIPDFFTVTFPDDYIKQNETLTTTGTKTMHPTIMPSTTNNNFLNPNSDPRYNNSLDGISSTTTVFPENFSDQKYWLLTVLRNDVNLPNLDVNATETKLSNLYSRAFNRREDKFFGGRKRVESVKAHIVNVTQIGTDIGLVYIIMVSGKPIPANTAANDMRLMTPSEVVAELGRPILTKAEPYAKVVVPLGARIRGRTRDTWLLIGCVIAAICLLILLVGLFALALSKKQNKKKSGNSDEEGGTSNLAFDEDTETKGVRQPSKPPRNSRLKPKSIKQENESIGGTVKFKEDERRRSSTSSTCSSEAGLVQFYTHQMKKDRREEGREKPKPKPRTRERRIQSSDCKRIDCKGTCVTSAGSHISQNTLDDSGGEEYSPRVSKSPTSYLSMPSVKAFPRGTKIPEPINKILEPTSIRHLDADSDSQKESSRYGRTQRVQVEVERGTYENTSQYFRSKMITRHPSLEGEDPGVIGPVVWNKHCQKIFERDTGISNDDECDGVHIGRMRKRFNELLDDALSMFGSSSGSPERTHLPPVKPPDNRVHSAILRPAILPVPETSSTCRPNTTGSKRPRSSTVAGPKGAWETPSCSTFARPYSAGIFQNVTPIIDKDLIFVNSELLPNDPAIPLIAAIKSELKKFDGAPSDENVE